MNRTTFQGCHLAPVVPKWCSIFHPTVQLREDPFNGMFTRTGTFFRWPRNELLNTALARVTWSILQNFGRSDFQKDQVASHWTCEGESLCTTLGWLIGWRSRLNFPQSVWTRCWMCHCAKMHWSRMLLHRIIDVPIDLHARGPQLVWHSKSPKALE